MANNGVCIPLAPFVDNHTHKDDENVGSKHGYPQTCRSEISERFKQENERKTETP